MAEVIDNDVVLVIMFSLMKRAKHLASTGNFEAVSVVMENGSIYVNKAL